MARTHLAWTLGRLAHERKPLVASLALFAFTAFGLTGCVSQEKYNAQKIAADQFKEQLAAAESQTKSATAQNEVYKQQLERIRNSGDNQAALLVNQAAQIADQARVIDELNSKYKQAMADVGKAGAGGGPLPAQLSNELTAFAAEHPDQVDFDPARGLVKFKSDVTFSPGSAEVKPEARSAIDKLASILNGATASQYDLSVVGHTDNQPVSNPATKAAGHLDNWYLSVHRAIAVSKELQKQGVVPSRIEVAGYGDQRPLEPNATKEAMARNRRVEVLILPTTGHTTPVAPSSGLPPVAGKSGKPTGKAAPNKDTAEVERRPYIGK